MRKLRPYVLSGLFVFHLMTVCVLLTTVSGEDKPSAIAGFVTLFSQFFLTALFAGLVPNSNHMGNSGLHRSSMCGSSAAVYRSFYIAGRVPSLASFDIIKSNQVGERVMPAPFDKDDPQAVRIERTHATSRSAE